ncbi:hypothetical protein L6R49_18995 [Myxococcota bacterium]|nr:hypothetical protein [Myxococcota bacterium]
MRLSFKLDDDERLLRALSPVREVFNLKDLDFEQLMQRDIDDARVATELIPYLLEESRSGLVKLFPPIIVVVLPVNDQKLPADHYPTVQSGDEDDGEGNTWHTERSGELGQEVFELRQLVQDGERWDHDYARLKLNTGRSALVIVDGQHRAMALIAMYRNCTKWPDNARAVEPYYKLWSRSVIERYDLDEVKLPVMFCVFPELDGRDPDQMPVHQACRAVFLALNKNARKVTRARNFLLDDRDIVSSFMRSVLTDIKASSDIHSKSTLRLWNVELDSDADRTALNADTAITGVTHLYGLIERITLRGNPLERLNAPSSAGRKQTTLEACFRRLVVEDLLSRVTRDEARRDTCDPATEAILVRAFSERFGRLLVRGLSDFAPYAANNEAALLIHRQLDAGATAEFYRTILFEGQSMDQVFESHVEWLKQEMKSPGRLRSPELRAVKTDFDGRVKELEVWRQRLASERINNLLGSVPEHVRESPSVRRTLHELHTRTFTTAAFQSALFITFFAAIERENERRSKPPEVLDPLTAAEVEALFDEYLRQVNELFAPTKLERLERLLLVLVGRLDVEGKSATVTPWTECLRHILIPGELKPDEWSKFRFMFAELWQPKEHPELKDQLTRLRVALRKQALDAYVTRKVKEHAQNLGVPIARLDLADVERLRAECVDHMTTGIRALRNLSDKNTERLRDELTRSLDLPETNAVEEMDG